MKIETNIHALRCEKPSCVLIGKFDGLHRGHMALIRKAAEISAEKNLTPVMITFDMTGIMLLTKEERRQILAAEGIRLLAECDFGPDIITMKAERFVREILVNQLHMEQVVIGERFRFGYGREGDGALLKEMGRELGFETTLVPEVMDGEIKVSSSVIRDELASGNMERVSALLGYPYFVTGRIIHGRQIGRTIGVPTANLITDRMKLLPPKGVYFSRCSLGGERVFNGITNIGTKPTVDGHFVGVETYFFDCNEDLYGEDLRVSLLHFSRPEQKFSSLEELKERIRMDEDEGRDYFAR